MASVGINEFVLRQTSPDFRGTRIPQEAMEGLRAMVEVMMNDGAYRDGYAPFCKIIRLMVPEILCPIARVTGENAHLLRTKYEARREGELPILVRYFDGENDLVKRTVSACIDVIVYSKNQLESEKDGNPSGADWDIICINAEPSEEGTPMTPETITRNALGEEYGGSGVAIDRDAYAKSVEFWSNHAMIA